MSNEALTSNNRCQRIDAILKKVFLKMNASSRSGSIQRQPDWNNWVANETTKTELMEDSDTDLLRGLRDGLLEVSKQIDETHAALTEELRQERHDRERLADQVTHLRELVEE